MTEQWTTSLSREPHGFTEGTINARIKKTHKKQQLLLRTGTYKPGDTVLILPQRLDPKMKLNQGHFRAANHNEANDTLQIR
jgi:hypothetical protein